MRRPAPPETEAPPAPVPVAGPKSFAPPRVAPVNTSSPPPLPLPLADPEPIAKAPAERRKGDYTLPPPSLLDAPRTVRKIDERELMDGARLLEEKCREFSVEGAVVADPPRSGRHDVRVQAGCGREVLEDHRPGRRSVPGDAGGIGADRPHSRQVDGRHPDSESHARADLAARAARIGGLSAIVLEARPGARQDDPRRAVRGRPRHHAAPPHRGIDGCRQVRRHQRHAHEHPVPRDAGRGADDHDRPQAARARHVRGHPAPADARGRRSQTGRQRPPVGRARDGGAVQDARGRGCPEHRAVQPQHPACDRREADAPRTASPSARFRSSSW